MRYSINYIHSFIMLKFQICTRGRSRVKARNHQEKNGILKSGSKLHFGALSSLQETLFWQHILPSSKLLALTDGQTVPLDTQVVDLIPRATFLDMVKSIPVIASLFQHF